MKRPRMIVLAPESAKHLDNPDAISFDARVWNEPWRPDNGGEIRFVELTPELLAWLRAQTWGDAGPTAPTSPGSGPAKP